MERESIEKIKINIDKMENQQQGPLRLEYLKFKENIKDRAKRYIINIGHNIRELDISQLKEIELLVCPSQKFSNIGDSLELRVKGNPADFISKSDSMPKRKGKLTILDKISHLSGYRAIKFLVDLPFDLSSNNYEVSCKFDKIYGTTENSFCIISSYLIDESMYEVDKLFEIAYSKGDLNYIITEKNPSSFKVEAGTSEFQCREHLTPHNFPPKPNDIYLLSWNDISFCLKK